MGGGGGGGGGGGVCFLFGVRAWGRVLMNRENLISKSS